MLLGGDFRQCLPVQKRAIRSEKVDLCIKSSALWPCFEQMKLKINERVKKAKKLGNVAEMEEQERFAKWVLQIGNDEEPKNDLDEVEIPNEVLCQGSHIDDLIEEIFMDDIRNENYTAMLNKVILAERNKEVAVINEKIIEKISGESRLYKSLDSVEELGKGIAYTSEFLNSFAPPDLPPHKLDLKINSIVMMMRNMSIQDGLCNGTRLLITEMRDNSIKTKILTGDKKHIGNIVTLFRINLSSDDHHLPVKLVRHQFPIRPAFAITINKAQGQTFEKVGIDLRFDVFDHGQLYVAISRARRFTDLKILLSTNREGWLTKNIVYREVL